MRIASSADSRLALAIGLVQAAHVGETRRILPRHQIERDDLAMKRGRPAHLFEGLARSEPVLDVRALQGIAARDLDGEIERPREGRRHFCLSTLRLL
jgi:hypothetical protein